MSHTPEPWVVNGSIRIESEHDHGVVNDGWIIGELDGPDAKENARRIVACVNACQGMKTDHLRGAAIILNEGHIAAREAAGEYTARIEKERDTYRELCGELLRAAQGYLPHMPMSTAKEGGANRHSGMLKASDNLKDAITKAEKLLGEKNGTN